ncbi:MAG: hypothetical protein AAGG48_14710 [Planctomycetota bacterium]
MTQQDLFDQGGYAPPVRNTDPKTSREAAQHIKPLRGRLAIAMLEVWKRYSLTANEAAAKCVDEHGGIHESYRKRKRELYDAGLIELVTTRQCSVTGMNAEVWRAKRDG